jgi:hypothetical protein
MTVEEAQEQLGKHPMESVVRARPPPQERQTLFLPLASLRARVQLVQTFRNAAACLAENALLLRSLLPGAPALAAAADSKAGSKKRRRASAGDSDAVAKPKRKATGYITFCTEKRKGLAAGSMPPTEIMKHLGGLWAKLSDKEKAVWNTRAANASAEPAEAVAAAPPAKKSKKSK